MKRSTKVLIWVVVLVALGCQEGRETATTDEKNQRTPLRVAVQRVESATLINSVSVTAEVEALAVVDVVPKVIGRLERLRLPSGVPIEEGTLVDKGKMIAVIEHSALQAAVQQADAAVEVARASHERVNVNLTESRREKIRWENLYKQGSATERQRDQAVTAYERSLAEAKLAEAQVAQAEAALRQARVNLDEATIEAPISGVVSEKYVDEGDMVGPTKALLRIVQIDTVKIVGGVSERHVSALVAEKTTARVAVDAYPEEEFDGVVHRVGAGVDRQTRTVKVEVHIPNADHRLKPGMFARLDLVLDRREDVVVVPDAALLRQDSEVYVYVVNNSKARRCTLKLGLSEKDQHEVKEGLKTGDLVIVKGQRMLQDDDEVEIVEESEP